MLVAIFCLPTGRACDFLNLRLGVPCMVCLGQSVNESLAFLSQADKNSPVMHECACTFACSTLTCSSWQTAGPVPEFDSFLLKNNPNLKIRIHSSKTEGEIMWSLQWVHFYCDLFTQGFSCVRSESGSGQACRGSWESRRTQDFLLQTLRSTDLGPEAGLGDGLWCRPLGAIHSIAGVSYVGGI